MFVIKFLPRVSCGEMRICRSPPFHLKRIALPVIHDMRDTVIIVKRGRNSIETGEKSQPWYFYVSGQFPHLYSLNGE